MFPLRAPAPRDAGVLFKARAQSADSGTEYFGSRFDRGGGLQVCLDDSRCISLRRLHRAVAPSNRLQAE